MTHTRKGLRSYTVQERLDSYVVLLEALASN